jgi:polyisoprenyl-teichoic acid--peptidoglycan teichoic acid transferase
VVYLFYYYKEEGFLVVKHGKKRIVFWVLGVFIVALASGAGYAYVQTSKITKVDIPKTNEELNISNDAASLDKEITNIALFGVDSRSDSDTGRSDSITILSIDRKHNKIKISSIMRDTYVKVQGYGMTKITHAYAYGGPALAIKTLNSNFDLNIKDYATVDFEGMQKIIDSLGGVKINIKSSEISAVNACIDEINRLDHISIKHISTSGLQNLNGAQAVAYSRVRHAGNGDFERTDRQRTVLTALFEKIKSGGVTKLPAMVAETLPYTETSINQLGIIQLGTTVFTSNMTTVDQVRFPVDGYCQDKTIGGIYYLVADLKTATNQIHNFIYDDEKPVAK